MTKKMTFPIHLLVLDIAGAVLVAMGVLRLQQDDTILAWAMVVAGFALMVPLVLYFVAFIRPGNTGEKKVKEE